ncbi:hypothetical protein [Brevibacillus massiliensis]|jgi:hypothetical protein|uniref:hypothetical protein n=1 Tax=Brevibacillus massiliensis TaxID=1118054 RepID=UPI00030E738F|nr:hypothetical protein [Brevibacillus massiliensis]
MDWIKLWRMFYLLNICFFITSLYLIVTYAFLGKTDMVARISMLAALNLLAWLAVRPKR